MPRLLTRKGWLILLTPFAVALAIGVARVVEQNRVLEEEVAALEAEAATLSAGNAGLMEFLKRFETDAFFERQARLKLNLQKEGEEVIALRNREEHGASIPDGARSPRPPNMLAKWYRYFFPQ